MSDLGIILNKSQRGNKDFQDNDAFSYSNTRLYDFLSKTSDTFIPADIVDPLCTFDVEVEFFPNQIHNGENTFLNDLTKKVFSSSIANSQNKTDGQLILQLGYYIQSISLPQMVMPEAGKVPTLFGEFPVNNLYIKPDNNTLTMSILNTKTSIHDFIFYPWMREVTLPFWVYDSQPYTTATITIKFDKHCNSRYVFCGCRPTQISSRQANQEPVGEPTRDVTILFDYMFITSVKSINATYNSSALTNATELFKNTNELQKKMI